MLRILPIYIRVIDIRYPAVVKQLEGQPVIHYRMRNKFNWFLIKRRSWPSYIIWVIIHWKQPKWGFSVILITMSLFKQSLCSDQLIILSGNISCISSKLSRQPASYRGMEICNAIAVFSTAIPECKANGTPLTTFPHLGSCLSYSCNKLILKTSYTLIAQFFLSDKYSACDNIQLFVSLLSLSDPLN